MSDVEIVVAGGEEDAALLVARRLDEAARAGGHICLTGGSTPKLAYELAAEMDPDWSRVELWWGDERCVPPDDPLSNYGMAGSALIDLLRTPPAAVHRMLGELGPDAGARAYEKELGDTIFDVLLLGMGGDGHIASLYPNQPTLDETERRVVGASAHLEPFVDRITVTLPVLCAAREIVFLIAGADKADAVARAFAGEPSRATPASLVRSTTGTTTVILDSPSAAQL
jgi:6-phosphogluconolactonase